MKSEVKLKIKNKGWNINHDESVLSWLLNMKKFTSDEIKEFVAKPLFDENIILNKDSSWPKISIAYISLLK